MSGFMNIKEEIYIRRIAKYYTDNQNLVMMAARSRIDMDDWNEYRSEIDLDLWDETMIERLAGEANDEDDRESLRLLNAICKEAVEKNADELYIIVD